MLERLKVSVSPVGFGVDSLLGHWRTILRVLKPPRMSGDAFTAVGVLALPCACSSVNTA